MSEDNSKRFRLYTYVGNSLSDGRGKEKQNLCNTTNVIIYIIYNFFKFSSTVNVFLHQW